MFWKAVVVAVWLALVARYQAFKRQRRARGTVLRYDARRDVYFDPLERTERRIKTAVYVLGAAFCGYALLVAWLLVSA